MSGMHLYWAAILGSAWYFRKSRLRIPLTKAKVSAAVPIIGAGIAMPFILYGYIMYEYAARFKPEIGH